MQSVTGHDLDDWDLIPGANLISFSLLLLRQSCVWRISYVLSSDEAVKTHPYLMLWLRICINAYTMNSILLSHTGSTFMPCAAFSQSRIELVSQIARVSWGVRYVRLNVFNEGSQE